MTDDPVIKKRRGPRSRQTVQQQQKLQQSAAKKQQQQPGWSRTFIFLSYIILVFILFSFFFYSFSFSFRPSSCCRACVRECACVSVCVRVWCECARAFAAITVITTAVRSGPRKTALTPARQNHQLLPFSSLFSGHPPYSPLFHSIYLSIVP